MSSLKAVLKHPDDFYPLLKLKMAAKKAEKQIPSEPHWAFSYSMLHKVSRSFALVIQQLNPQLRDAVCIFYLVLPALDTVEDDTSIAIEICLVPTVLLKDVYERSISSTISGVVHGLNATVFAYGSTGRGSLVPSGPVIYDLLEKSSGHLELREDPEQGIIAAALRCIKVIGVVFPGHGYCTLVEFENAELGVPVSFSGDKQVAADQKTMAVDKMVSKEITEEIGKEKDIVNNASDTQEMETDKPREEPVRLSLVTSTEKPNVKQASASTVSASKPAKRRITPMAID